MSEGKEIVQPGAPDVKTPGQESRQVARQRRRLAGDVEEAAPPAPARERTGQRRGETRARRVRDGDVERVTRLAEERQSIGMLDRPGLGPPAFLRGERLLDGCMACLDSHDFVSRVEQRAGKESDAAEEIEGAGGRNGRGFSRDGSIERLQKMTVRLEEGPGGQRKLAILDSDPETPLAAPGQDGTLGVHDRDSVERSEERRVGKE